MGIAWARKQKEELELTRGEAAEVRVRVLLYQSVAGARPVFVLQYRSI